MPQLKWIDLGVATLVLILLAFSAPQPEILLPMVVLGLLWGVLGWTQHLPLTLLMLLLGIASRAPLTSEVLSQDLWVLCYGLSIWTAAIRIPPKVPYVGWGLGAAWGLIMWPVPAFWVSGLCMLPKLGVLQPGRLRGTIWSGMVVGGTVMIISILTQRTGGMFERPGDVRTYEEIYQSFSLLLATPSLLYVLAFVALFDLAQQTEERVRCTWSNLAFVGIPLLFLFLPADRAVALFFWTAIPAMAVLLVRWTLVLPHLLPRILFWSLLGLIGVLS